MSRMAIHPLVEPRKPAMTPSKKGDGIGHTDWSDPRSVAQLARRLWMDSDQIRLDHTVQFIRNVEFMLGNQWLQWNPRTRQMEMDPARSRWDVRYVFPRIHAAIEKLNARMLQREPTLTAKPVTDDEQDRIVARLQTQLLAWHVHDGMRLRRKLEYLLTLARMCPTVYVRLFWDVNSGDPVEVPFDMYAGQMPPPMPEMGMAPPAGSLDSGMSALARPMGEEDAGGEEMPDQDMASEFDEMFGAGAAAAGLGQTKTGDLDIEILTRLDVVRWPFDATCHDEVGIYEIARRRSIYDVAARYGLDVEDVRSIAKPPDDDDWRRTMATGYGTQSVPAVPGALDLPSDEFIYEFELYVPPGQFGYPKGRFAVVLGFDDEAVVLDDIRTPCNKLPLFAIQEMPVPGRLDGTCKVDQLIPTQQAINLAETQKANYRNRRMAPRVFRIAGDGCEDDVFSNDPKKIGRLNSPQHMPQVLETPEIGFQNDRDIEGYIRHFNDISGVSSVDQGYAAGDSVKSGKAILSLQQANAERGRPFGERLDEVLGQVATLAMEIYQEKAVDVRTLARLKAIAGEDNILELIEFNRDSLRPSNYGKPGAKSALVVCSSFRDLPADKETVVSLVDFLTQRQYLNPIRDRRFVLRALGFGDIREAFDQDRADEARQNWEINQWRDGKPAPVPKVTENHEVHLWVLAKWINSEEFDEMAQQNPVLAQQAMDHYELHQEGLLRTQAKAQYLAVMADVKEWAAAADRAAKTNPAIAELYFSHPLGPAGQAAAMDQAMTVGPIPGQQPEPGGKGKPPASKDSIDRGPVPSYDNGSGGPPGSPSPLG